MYEFIEVEKNHQDSCVKLANEIIDLVRRKPTAVIGLATGTTPEPVYAEIVRQWEEGQKPGHRKIDFSRVTFFALDEYVGLPENHEQSYRRYLYEKLLGPIHASADRIHLPYDILREAQGQGVDLTDSAAMEPYCDAYEQKIRDAGNIDLQILGVGPNGHLAFNEPPSAIDSRTRVEKLSEETRRANSPNFNNDINQVPPYAVTMGLGTLAECAKKMVIIASGPVKAQPLGKASKTPKDHEIPTSFLDVNNPVSIVNKWAVTKRVKLYLDPEAASQLGAHWTRTGISSSSAGYSR